MGLREKSLSRLKLPSRGLKCITKTGTRIFAGDREKVAEKTTVERKEKKGAMAEEEGVRA